VADYNAPPIFEVRGIMGIRVCKFGGSSVADAEQLRKVRAIVEDCDDRRFIVPSAPGRRAPDDEKVTDLLFRAHETAAQGRPIESLFDRISERYRKIVADLGLEFDLDSALCLVHDRIRDGAGASYAASRGEYLSGLVIAHLLDRPLIDPVEMIRFDESGRFLPEETQIAVSARLADEETGVIPGFYGALPDGSIQTFSRGGSDVTGAIVSRGVGAEIYENWTDVSGLLMADPRIVREPHTIKELTYRELRELAYMGATVLHDEAIFPVRDAGIPVHILNTNDPAAGGTHIRRRGDDHPPTGRITGVAGRKDFTIIALEKTLMNSEIGFGRRVLGVLELHGISWEHMPSGIDTLSIVLKSDVVEEQIGALVEEIKSECAPDSVEIHSGIALIATVGRGMSHAPGTAAQLFGALAAAGINIRMIDQGSSELNIIVGVENADFERTVQAIYNAFVRPSPD
jgi:aspartate kinase